MLCWYFWMQYKLQFIRKCKDIFSTSNTTSSERFFVNKRNCSNFVRNIIVIDDKVHQSGKLKHYVLRKRIDIFVALINSYENAEPSQCQCKVLLLLLRYLRMTCQNCCKFSEASWVLGHYCDCVLKLTTYMTCQIWANLLTQTFMFLVL